MTTTHTTRVVAAEAETKWRDGAYHIDCEVCGRFVTYRGWAFTSVEADRHERYFAEAAKRISRRK